MEINDERTARTYVADWHAALERKGSGCMRVSYAGNVARFEATARALGTALAIMNAAPHRYGDAQRANMRAAIAYLRHGAHPYAQPVTVAAGAR